MIIGIGVILPGFSGSSLCILLKCYDTLLSSIASLKNNFKNSLKVLLPFLIGIIISIMICTIPLFYLIENYSFFTYSLLIGLFISQLYIILKEEIKKLSIINIIFLFFGFIVFFSGMNFTSTLSFLSYNSSSYLSFIFIGIISAFCLLVPCLSITFILSILNFYNYFIDSTFFILNNLKSINYLDYFNYFKMIFFLGLGFILSIIIFAKLINTLLKKHHDKFIMFFLGGSVFNIFSLVLSSDFISQSFKDESFLYMCYNSCVGLMLFIVGYIIIQLIFKRGHMNGSTNNRKNDGVAQ